MEVKLQLNYTELLHLISQLPVAKQLQLKSDLAESEEEKIRKNKFDLRKLILNGPIMTDDEYQNFLQNKQWINEWRTI